MESLATAIIRGWEAHVESEEKKKFKFRLPVNTICGITIIAEIGIGNSKGKIEFFVFRVLSFETGDIETIESCEPLVIYAKSLMKGTTESLTIEEVKAYIEEILKIIPTLSFNKRSGRLTTDYVYDDDVVSLFEFDNTTTLIYEKCCVCHDLTGTRTPCRHSLCLVCISSLPEVDSEEEDEMPSKKCPLCRETIEMIF